MPVTKWIINMNANKTPALTDTQMETLLSRMGDFDIFRSDRLIKIRQPWLEDWVFEEYWVHEGSVWYRTSHYNSDEDFWDGATSELTDAADDDGDTSVYREPMRRPDPTRPRTTRHDKRQVGKGAARIAAFLKGD